MFQAIFLTACGTCAMALAVAQVPLCVDETFHLTFAPTGSVGSIEFMADGRLLVGGNLKRPGPIISYMGMTRLTGGGAIDPTFGPNYVGVANQVEIWEDSFIFLMSNGGGYQRLFLADGTNDYSYGSPLPEFSTSQAAYYHIFPDGKQWRTGSYSKQFYDDEGHQIGNQQGFGLIQVLPDGHIDPDFDNKLSLPGMLWAIHELPDGRFLIGATSEVEYEGRQEGALIRVWPDAGLDTTFHSSINWARMISKDFYHYPDGRLLVFGRMMAPEYPNDTLAVMRLNPDGSTDTTWPSIPFLNYGYFRGLAAITGFLEIEPGKLIVVGQFNAIGDQPVGAIAAIDTSGNVLWDYLPGTGAGFTEQIDNNSPECYIQGIKQGPDGHIYIFGSFSGYNDGCGVHPEQRLISRLYPLNVGVEKHPADKDIGLFPNPGTDKMNVSFDGQGGYAVSVQDLQGRTVLERIIGSGTAQIDVSSLSQGMYTVLFIGADGERSTTKWIKQ